MAGIYLAFNSESLIDVRSNLLNTLIKSGQQVYPSDLSFTGNYAAMSQTIKEAEISVHILGLKYEEMEGSEPGFDRL
jgi:hypothetical protein